MQVDPKIDFAFKCLFGSEQRKHLLIALLKAVLRIEIADVTILNPYNEKESAEDKLSILDVKAKLSDGTFINIEMQVTVSLGYAERSLYYWSSLYVDQLGEGSEYSELARTVAIHIIDDVLFPEVPAYHMEFGICSLSDPAIRLTDRFALHTIELPKMNLPAGSLSSELDGWCYFLRHAEEMDLEGLPKLPAELAIRQAMEALRVMFQTERERDLYRGRLKQTRDALWIQNASRKQGLDAGRVEGQISTLHKDIARVLAARFGQASSIVAERIASLSDVVRLDLLVDDALKVPSLEEFEKLL